MVAIWRATCHLANPKRPTHPALDQSRVASSQSSWPILWGQITLLLTSQLLTALCYLRAEKGRGHLPSAVRCLLWPGADVSWLCLLGPASSCTMEQETRLGDTSSNVKGQILIWFNSAVIEVAWVPHVFQLWAINNPWEMAYLGEQPRGGQKWVKTASWRQETLCKHHCVCMRIVILFRVILFLHQYIWGTGITRSNCSTGFQSSIILILSRILWTKSSWSILKLTHSKKKKLLSS